MHIGHYISGIAHTGLIGWVLFGGVLNPDPPPMEVTDVSVISSAEFDALLRAQVPPDTATEVALSAPPQELPPSPQVSSQTDEAPAQVAPTETAIADPDEAPELTELTPPEPIAPEDLVQEVPDLLTPESEVAVQIPDVPQRPAAQPAERVAPEPVAPPKPEAAIAETVQDATQPDDSALAQPQEEVLEDTAPEAASTEIATEPKQQELASAAPSRSLRPRVRPKAAPEDTTEPEETRASAATDEAIAALAEASASEAAESAAAPSGPPLSQGERDGLRVAVQQCWVVDVGSRAADVTVVVGFALDRNGKVQGDITMLSAEGGDTAAAQTAFQAARRAVLRCQKDGYDLPVEKYDHWRDVEITFNPDNMRRR